MIRAGLLCRDCGGGCKEGEQLGLVSIEVECPECEGAQCDACGGSGAFELQGCPVKYVREISRVIPLCDAYKAGHLPVPGGVLNQSAWFIKATQVLHGEDARIVSEQYAK